MKQSLKYLLATMPFLFFGAGQGHLYGQFDAGFEIPLSFSLGNGKTGKLQYWVRYSNPTIRKQYSKDPKNLEISMNGESTGILYLDFKWDEKHNKDYKLVFSKSCITASGSFKLKAQSRQGFVLTKNGAKTGTLEFDIVENNNGLLMVDFEVVPLSGTGTGGCQKAVRLNYTVEKMLPKQLPPTLPTPADGPQVPPIDACTQAKNAYRQNPETGIELLRKYLKDYPNGPCAAEFRLNDQEAKLFEKVKYAADKKNCEDVKKHGKAYHDHYPSGHYTTRVKGFEKAFPKKCPTKNEGPKSPPPAECDKAWLAIKEATCADVFEAFLKAHPNCPQAEDARTKLKSLSEAAGFSVASTSNGVTVIADNGQRLKWKDMSLEGRLNVSPSGQEVKADFKDGTYFLRVKADCGKDSLLELRSDFHAKMDVSDKGRLFTITVFGGEGGYSAHLMDLNKKIPRSLPGHFIKDNQITFTKKDLDLRLMYGDFMLEIKDKAGHTYQLEELIKNEKEPFDIVLVLVSLLFTVAFALLVYMLFVYFRNKKRKETIYDIEY